MKSFSKNVMVAQRDMVILEGAFTVGASGAVSNVDGSDIESVTLGVKPGLYAIELEDTLNKYFGFQHSFYGAVPSTIGSVQVVSETVASDKEITIQCYDITGTEASPASGCTMRFVIHLRQTGVQGKGE